MLTLKIKYHATDEALNIIKSYQSQYTKALRVAYNRFNEGLTPKLPDIQKLNNIELLDGWIILTAISEARMMYNSLTEINKNLEDGEKPHKLIFGGRKNFIARCQNKITREEFLEKRLLPYACQGEKKSSTKSVHGNRKFKLNEDLTEIIVKLGKEKYHLQLPNLKPNLRKQLAELYRHQVLDDIPISYKIDCNYVYITYDENLISDFKNTKTIENRVMAIDLNPNYVGWSVVDWKSSSEFNVIEKGVFSIKEINDRDFGLKGKGYSSESKERKHLTNKRNHEVYEISKNLIDKALYYRCELFSMEGLEISRKKKTDESANRAYRQSKKYRKLVNNMWNRDKLVNNLKKRCNIYKIKYLEVKPDYSSFVGNFLFRGLGLPDMVLASVEIGRRGYEYNCQYIKKTKEQRRNIIRPEIRDFVDRYAKSLEEFGIEGEFKDMVELYYRIKNTGMMYRVPLDKCNPRFSVFKHKKSNIGCVTFENNVTPVIL